MELNFLETVSFFACISFFLHEMNYKTPEFTRFFIRNIAHILFFRNHG